MGINTGSFAKALWPGVNKWFGDSYNEFPVEFTQIFDEEKSSKAYEEEVGVSGFGLLKEKNEMGGFDFDLASQGFTMRYVMKTYALGFTISMEMLQDNQYDLSVLGKRDARALAMSARQTKETIGANVLNRAFTAGYTFGDSTVLCSATQPTKAGGTFANTLSVAADLSEASLEQACIDIMDFRNDRGLRIAVQPSKLIIPKNLVFEANRILKSTGQNDTANNALNALKDTGIIPSVVVNHYLTDTDAWFVKTNVPDGLKWFNRIADDFAMDNEFSTMNAQYRCYFRCAFGVTDKRGIYGSPGA